jgi:hypothetical protein
MDEGGPIRITKALQSIWAVKWLNAPFLRIPRWSEATSTFGYLIGKLLFYPAPETAPFPTAAHQIDRPATAGAAAPDAAR